MISPKISNFVKIGLDIRESMSLKHAISDSHWRYIAELYLKKINQVERFSEEESPIQFGIEEAEFIEEKESKKNPKFENFTYKKSKEESGEDGFKVKDSKQLNKKS